MGKWKWKAVCNEAPFTVGKFPSVAGLELRITRSAGQHFTYWATKATNFHQEDFVSYCVVASLEGQRLFAF